MLTLAQSAELLGTSSACVTPTEDAMVRRTSFQCGLALLVMLLEGAAPANAQQRACFAETGHCIGGRKCRVIVLQVVA
jgi:hypothetical protein